MSGKRSYSGAMVPYARTVTRPAKVQRKAKKGKVGLRGLMIKTKPELKEWQFASGLNYIVQSGNLYIVNQIPQGTNYNNRIGNHVRAKYLRINYICWVPTSINTYDDVRIIVVWDTQPNGAANAQIYSAGGTTANSILDNFAAPIVAFKNTALAGDRFIILRDQQLTVQSTTAAVTTSNNNQFDTRRFSSMYIDLRGQDMEFNTTTGGIPTTGAIYVCLVSANNSATQAQNAQFVFNSKLMFTDV